MGVALATAPANATIVSITQSDLPGGDVLFLSSLSGAEELGDPEFGFPPGEELTHSVTTTSITVCDNMPDSPTIANRLITITNLQDWDVGELFYVVNGLIVPGTFSNYDGLVNGVYAMKIDSVGFNRPLIYESMDADGIFQGGETWRFVVQDYVSATGSGNFVTPGEVGGSDSQPSIIVPEPSVLTLGLFAGLLLFRRRR